MKWIAALLMIINVAVYLWAGGHQATLDEATSKSDVNKEGMLLLSEIGNLKNVGMISGSQQSVDKLAEPGQGQIQEEVSKPASASEEIQGDQPLISTLADGPRTELLGQQLDGTLVENEEAIIALNDLPEQGKLVQSPVHSCYRLGPFKKEEFWQAARQWMEQNGYQFRPVTSDSRELRAVRVYLGPFNSITSSEFGVRQLKEKNLEHFVYLEDSGQAKISLGYFIQKELAVKFLAYLQSIGVDAKSEPEYRLLGPFNWMEIPTDGVDKIQISTHDWAEPTVDLSEIAC